MGSDPFRRVSSRTAGDLAVSASVSLRDAGLAAIHANTGQSVDRAGPGVAAGPVSASAGATDIWLFPSLLLATLVTERLATVGPPASALAVLTMLLWRLPVGRQAALPGLLACLVSMMALVVQGQGMATIAEPACWLAMAACVAVLLRLTCGARDPFATLPDLARFTLCVAFAGPLFLATTLSFPAGWSTAAFSYWLHRFADVGERMLLISSGALILSRGASTLRLRDSAGGRMAGWALAALLAAGLLAITILWPMLEGEPAFLLAALALAGLVFMAQRQTHGTGIAELRASETRYRLLAQGNGDAVFLIDGDGICRHATAPVWAVLGHHGDARLDRSMLAHVHPADRPMLRDAVLSAFARPTENQTILHRARHADGQWLWIETRLRMLADPTGQAPAGLACTIRDVSAQVAREQALERRAAIDSLTGLLNRDSVYQALHVAIQTARTEGHGLALILFDVDHFKRINDAHGHPFGDRVLQALGDVCRTIVPLSDHAGRVGGEEFAVILQDAGIAAAIDTCARLRANIASRVPRGADGRPVAVTISCGVALLEPGMAYDGLVFAADRALYAAKHAGRDRVFVSIDGQMIRAI